MQQLYYNILKNSRIKNIALATILLFTNALIVFHYFNREKAEGTETSIYVGLVISVFCIGLVFLIALIPFGQVIEKINEASFVTYYKIGRLKLNVKVFENPTSVIIIQDGNRYYCLTIVHSNGQNLIVEKYPTLGNAELRVTELKRIFG